jgi:hypothetical protein
MNAKYLRVHPENPCVGLLYEADPMYKFQVRSGTMPVLLISGN